MSFATACGGGSGNSSRSGVFIGDFESGDLSQWDNVQALPGKAGVVERPVAEGAYAGRFEVEKGDEEPETGSQRAEVISGEEFEEGDVRYFRILSRVESWDYSTWGIVWQIHDDSDGTPPLSLQLERDGSTPMLWLGPGDAAVDLWEAPLQVGEWFEIVIRVAFADEGSVAVWLNGEPQTMLDADGGTVFDPIDTLGAAPDYDKLGIYRSRDSTDPAVVYHDGYRIGEQFFSDPP
ncbi:MAG TPA: polysaccharide lyase [Solirubrobacterales bacterium]|nr:polysaccharide lyase [Solirubrobacterales bacterium]